GVSRPDVVSFVLQDKQTADLMIFDGQILEPLEFAVLPPGSNFTIASEGSHRWMSATMPVALFAQQAAKTGQGDVARIVNEKRLVSPPQGLPDISLANAAGAAEFARETQASTIETGPAAGIVSDLLTALTDVISGANRTFVVPTDGSRSTDRTVT